MQTTLTKAVYGVWRTRDAGATKDWLRVNGEAYLLWTAAAAERLALDQAATPFGKSVTYEAKLFGYAKIGADGLWQAPVPA